jgi:LacI family transcriptional regulator
VDAHRQHKLAVDDSLLLIEDLSEQSALDAAANILKMESRPDGLVVTNDFVAAVIMQNLKENGLRVPHDIAIVGFNNDIISKLVEPKLTTIDYPGTDMGLIIASNLINHLKGVSDIKQTSTVVVRSGLIVRESSLKLNAGG